MELGFAVLAQAQMPARQEQHGHIVGSANTASALLPKLPILVERASVRVVDVVHVRGRAVVRALAVAAPFLARIELVMRIGEWELLLLRLLQIGSQIGLQMVHHGLRVPHLGLPVMRLGVQLIEPLHELVVLHLRLLQFAILLPQLPRVRLLHGRHQLLRVPLPLLVQKTLQLLILRRHEVTNPISIFPRSQNIEFIPK